MGAGKALSPQEEGKIESFTTDGWSQRTIAEEIGRDKKAVLNHQRQLSPQERNINLAVNRKSPRK